MMRSTRRELPPEIVPDRNLFPASRIAGHTRPRVRIPSERELVRGRATRWDMALYVGGLLWLSLLLVYWSFLSDRAPFAGLGLLVATLGLPLSIATFLLLDWTRSLAAPGQRRWRRWARARGMRPISPRRIRRELPLLQWAPSISTFYAGNVGGYRLGVGCCHNVERGDDEPDTAHFRAFVYAYLPARLGGSYDGFTLLPKSEPGTIAPRAAERLAIEHAGLALSHTLWASPRQDEARLRELLDEDLADALASQPNAGLQQAGRHLVLWAPTEGRWSRLLIEHADPDLEPASVDALCDLALRAVRKHSSGSAG